MINLAETNAGYFFLPLAAFTIAFGATASDVTGFRITTTNTGMVVFNGLAKNFAAVTNVNSTFLPAAVTSAYNQQVAPKNLLPSQKCAVVICVDWAGTLYWVQGPVVDSSQNSAPIPSMQQIVTSAAASLFDLPVAEADIVPIGYVVLSTTAAVQYQFPGGPTMAAIGGVTTQAYSVAANVTVGAWFPLFNWPSSSL